MHAPAGCDVAGCRSLNVNTTAEAVETMDQLDWPAAEIEQLLFRFGRQASQAA
jgi:hypothetical protein